MEAGGLILGIMKAMIPYAEGEVEVRPGDRMILFTDGVSEAMNAKDEEWGEERLEAIVLGRAADDPTRLLDAIVEAIREHGKDVAQQSDDITLIIAQALPA